MEIYGPNYKSHLFGLLLNFVRKKEDTLLPLYRAHTLKEVTALTHLGFMGILKTPRIPNINTINTIVAVPTLAISVQEQSIFISCILLGTLQDSPQRRLHVRVERENRKH